MFWNVSSGLQDKEKFRMEKSAFIAEISKLSETIIYVWNWRFGCSE